MAMISSSLCERTAGLSYVNALNGTDSLYPQARPEKVEWVTPKTTFNRCETRYILRDNATSSLKAQYGDLCLVVRIGKVGERWTYPTVAQLDKEWEKEHEGGMAMGVRDEIMYRAR